MDRQKDWLDKASDPAHGAGPGLWFIVIVVLLVACVGGFAVSLLL